MKDYEEGLIDSMINDLKEENQQLKEKLNNPQLRDLYMIECIEKKLKADFIKKLKELIEHRDNERKNNNIWRKSEDELNEDFIDDLNKLIKSLEEGK